MSCRSYRRVVTGLGIVVCLVACLVVGADKKPCEVTMGGAASGYTCEVIYARGRPGLCGITRSPDDGTVYAMRQGKNLVGIVTLAITDDTKKTVEATPLTLPTEFKKALDGADYGRGASSLVAGPNKTLYTTVGDDLWKVYYDANTKTWKEERFENFTANFVAYDPHENRLLGYPKDAQDRHVLHEWDPSKLKSIDWTKETASTSFADCKKLAAPTGPSLTYFPLISDIASSKDAAGNRVLLVSCKPESNPICFFMITIAKDGTTTTTEILKRRPETEGSRDWGLKNDPVFVAYHQDRKSFFVRTTKDFLEIKADGKMLVKDHTSSLVDRLASRTPTQFVFLPQNSKKEWEALFVDATDSQIVYMNLTTGKTSVALPSEGCNSPALAVDSSGRVYFGIPGYPVKIRSIDSAGKNEKTWVVKNLDGQVRDIAFGRAGELYIATYTQAKTGETSSISYVVNLKNAISPVNAVTVADKPGNHFLSLAVKLGANKTLDRLLATSVVNGRLAVGEYSLLTSKQGSPEKDEFVSDKNDAEILQGLGVTSAQKKVSEFRIAWDAKGKRVYGYLSDDPGEGQNATRWILRLGLAGKKLTIEGAPIAKDQDKGSNRVTGNLSTDSQGVCWWLLSPTPFVLKKVTITTDANGKVTGKVEDFATNLPIDPAAVESYYDSAGHHVYMTSPQGIHHFFKPSPSEGKKKGACVCPGDKLTPGISKTSKHAC